MVADDRLMADMRALIEAAREQACPRGQLGMAGLYWHIGMRIRKDILQEKRAGYGEAIVATLFATIDGGVRPRLRPPQSLPYDPLCRGFPG